ncbi:class I SAM-dependent methyltransferase [Parablastomonas sp. CN1-191]|uniref:class I SAM-dependent methyltransferase n=1 Tax=Parablastomonas sp. CN1-191 TaxID=3400908 RepID=UPI003BF90700
MRTAAAALLALVALTACTKSSDRAPDVRAFPSADRPVSKLGGSSFTTEDQRDNLGEAETVMDLARIAPGMTVADIGAGEGYYTVRLAERVGRKGRVLAQDIDSAVLHRLGSRVERERLDNVSIKLGKTNDPMLPAGSFDRVFMVHMYHEVGEPYAFLWRLRPSLKPGGQVIVVDSDRPSAQHGMPPEQLFCEFQAVGFRLAEFVRKPELRGYYAQFEAVGPAPAPQAIKPCTGEGKTGPQ